MKDTLLLTQTVRAHIRDRLTDTRDRYLFSSFLADYARDEETSTQQLARAGGVEAAARALDITLPDHDFRLARHAEDYCRGGHRALTPESDTHMPILRWLRRRAKQFRDAA